MHAPSNESKSTVHDNLDLDDNHFVQFRWNSSIFKQEFRKSGVTEDMKINNKLVGKLAEWVLKHGRYFSNSIKTIIKNFATS